MPNASVLPSREMTQLKMHMIAREAVDEIRPFLRPDLNKKGFMDWFAREMSDREWKLGFDRVRKAYGKRVKCIEHHEIMTWEERYVRFLSKWEDALAARHEGHRKKIRLWQERHSANAAADPTRAAARADQPGGC